MKTRYIVNDSKRRATYKVRTIGMKKKLYEISTLCGIEACALIYGQDETEPEVWPSHAEAQKVLNRFSAMNEIDQRKYMLNQETHLDRNFKKALHHLKTARDQNRKNEMELFMFQCLGNGSINVHNADTIDMNYFMMVINQNLREIEGKLSREQAQNGTGVAANEAGTSNGERVIADGYNYGMVQTNMGAMQTQVLDESSGLANGIGNVMFPFGGYNHSSGFGHGPYFP